MKKINWPKIKKLTKYEKIWLEKVYEKVKNHENPTYKKIKVELIKSLPIRFNPSTIDKRLAGYKGEDLTLFGVYTIDPKSDLIDIINIVGRHIGDCLVKDPTIKYFKASEIAADLKIDATKVGLALKFLSDFGKYWRSASYGSGYGYDTIQIEGDDEIFDNFIYFDNVEDIINKYYSEKQNKESEDQYQADLNEESENSILRFNPIFRSRVEKVDLNLCFVLMPFTQK